jgi:hypothetical protein
MTRFFRSENCRFLDVRRPLWRENGSVIYLYNCFWALPEQSLSGPSPAELMTIFYYLIRDSPSLQGQVPVFISARNIVAQLHSRALGSLFVVSYYSQGYSWGILTCLHKDLVRHWVRNSKFEVILRPTVGRPNVEVKWSEGNLRPTVCFGVVLSSVAHYQLFVFCRKIAGFLMRGTLSHKRMGL